MGIPGHEILHFQFLKVELKSTDWRTFIDSDNPVAAALLAKMGYTEKEKREVRFSYLRMLFRLKNRINDAKLALIMSVADYYFEPDIEEDKAMIHQLCKEYPEEGDTFMKLLPAFAKKAYEEGIEQGKVEIIKKLLQSGLSPETVADAIGVPTQDLNKMKDE